GRLAAASTLAVSGLEAPIGEWRELGMVGRLGEGHLLVGVYREGAGRRVAGRTQGLALVLPVGVNRAPRDPVGGRDVKGNGGRRRGSHHGPDLANSLTVGIPGLAVTGVGIERPAVIRDLVLDLAVVDDAQSVGHALPARRFAHVLGQGERSPGLQTRAGAGVLALVLVGVVIEGPAGVVD